MLHVSTLPPKGGVYPSLYPSPWTPDPGVRMRRAVRWRHTPFFLQCRRVRRLRALFVDVNVGLLFGLTCSDMLKLGDVIMVNGGHSAKPSSF